LTRPSTRASPAGGGSRSFGGRSSAANGFIPFEGLSQKERYAEVLGHELVHAV